MQLSVVREQKSDQSYEEHEIPIPLPSKDSKEKILSDLRAKLRAQLASTHGVLPFSLIEGGVPRGALVHFSGAQGGGKTELALQFLAENPRVKVAWIEDQLTVYPLSFLQLGTSLDRVLFIQAESEILWTFSQILNSQLFDVVVLASRRIHLSQTELRRLQLMAERSGSCCMFLSENVKVAGDGDWSLSLKVQVERSSLEEPPAIRVIKQRHMVPFDRGKDSQTAVPV